MRDAEHELSENESDVEIIPLPAEKELPTGNEYKLAIPVERTHHFRTWRFIMTAVVLCLVLAFVLANVVLVPHKTSQPSSRSTSPAAAPTATSAPSNTSSDYSVYTTIANGVAYVSAANGTAYALRTSNGNLLWRHKIEPGANTAPLVDNGVIYITADVNDTGPGYVDALRASDGAQLWRYISSDPPSTVLVNNGIAYVTSNAVALQNGSLVALRAIDGVLLWHHSTRGSSYDSLVVSNQIVFVSTSTDSRPDTVYALQANDGTPLWHSTTTTFISVSAVVNGIAYLFSEQQMSALQASSGQLLWKVAVEGNSSLLSQVSNGVLYVITTKISLETTATPTSQVSMPKQVGAMGNLLQSILGMAPAKQTVPLKGGVSSVYAVRISDGAVLWHYTMSKEGGNNWANWLSLENGTVYTGTYVDQDKSYIYALRSSDGSLLWRQPMRQGMSANASIANGVIYIASFINDGSLNQGSGAVYALRASDGMQLWYHQMYWVVYNTPMLVGATVYVSTAGGDVFAFRASDGSTLWHFHTDV